MGIPLIVVEVAGWTGGALILTAYILVSMGKLSGQSRLFQWMNIIGAAGFTLNGGYHGAIPSMVLNIIWMGIGMMTLYRISKDSRSAGPVI
jgi:hypothetical protein